MSNTPQPIQNNESSGLEMLNIALCAVGTLITVIVFYLNGYKSQILPTMIMFYLTSLMLSNLWYESEMFISFVVHLLLYIAALLLSPIILLFGLFYILSQQDVIGFSIRRHPLRR